MAWVVGSTSWTRKIGSREVGREAAYAARLAVVGIYTSRMHESGSKRPKQIFGASPLKTRDEPTDELICFPTTPLSSLSFFRLSAATFSRLPLTPPSPRDAYIAENIRASI